MGTKITKVRVKKISFSSPSGQRIIYLLSFSWNQKHRPIHEKALLHYFDPNKNGQKFAVSQTDPAATSTPPRGPSVSLSHHFDLQQEVRHDFFSFADLVDPSGLRCLNDGYSDKVGVFAVNV